jgi:uncharacterized membrane protein
MPLLFGAGAEGARGMLTAIASSMITVAGVIFSITIVALSLASSQYTSRVLRNYMKDRTNQATLGVIVGVFVYCLVVLRTIRGGDEGSFVPSLSVLFGVVLAFVAIGYLIYFIHHIASSIQAAHILESVTAETLAAVDHLFPENLGRGADPVEQVEAPAAATETVWSIVPALRTGYLQRVDSEALLRFAREQGRVVRMERGIGEFAIESTPLVALSGAAAADARATARLNRAFIINRLRTVEQDASFGIRQIVDVALKALSPGINDTTTAVMCVNYLSAILTRLAQRRIASPYRMDAGELRVIARGPSFASLVREAFDQIRQNAGGNVAVLGQLLQSLRVLAGTTENSHRRRVLTEQVEAVAEVVSRTIPFPRERAELEAEVRQVAELL